MQSRLGDIPYTTQAEYVALRELVRLLGRQQVHKLVTNFVALQLNGRALAAWVQLQSQRNRKLRRAILAWLRARAA